MSESGSLRNLQTAGLIVVGLAIIIVMGILVLEGFKDAGVGSTQTNTTIDQFITGLAIVGGFVGIIMLAIIGKIIVQLFKD